MCVLALLKLANDPDTVKFCSDCKTHKTPMWRRNRCNACGLNYKNGDFCSICQRSFRKPLDASSLIKCALCKEVQVHIACAPRGPYACPDCAYIILDELADFACE